MQKRKILNVINIFLIIIAFIISLNYIYNDNSSKTIENKINIKNSYRRISDNRILIESLNINLPIEEGINKELLDKNVVGLYKEYSSFSDDNIPIILAGHNNKSVFRNLYNIKLNDIVNVTYDDNEYFFKVEKVLIVNSNDTSTLENVYNEKKLILITCKEEDTRFIVICNKI